jgi:chemotaxis family two-component system response regulator Rcp1
MRQAPELLLVDDNPADVTLVRESLADTIHQSHIHSVLAGADAISFLRRTGKHVNVIRPDLVILDLNLPATNGYQILSEMKADVDLRKIPVVVFSSSESKRDIARSYELGANCYVSKPADLKRFFAVVRAIEEFWFGYARLQEGQCQ